MPFTTETPADPRAIPQPDVPFSEVLENLNVASSGFETIVPDDWLQGRTAYGGLSAALCIEAALRTYAQLPPLRSAQFAFIGPAAGLLAVQCALLRQGRSATFVEVSLSGEAGLAVRGTLCFGAARASAIQYRGAAAPSVRPWDEADVVDTSQLPKNARHFDIRLAAGALPRTSGADPAITAWIRHGQGVAGDRAVALTALADVLPPPALVLASERAPISTMTWTLDFLSGDPQSQSGWWLAESIADAAGDGYSGQTMRIWDDHGRPAIFGRQTVAMFG